MGTRDEDVHRNNTGYCYTISTQMHDYYIFFFSS